MSALFVGAVRAQGAVALIGAQWVATAAVFHAVFYRDTGACPEQARLQRGVEDALAKLVQVTTLQVEVFRSHDTGAFKRLDKELELVVGEKERAIGALRQHVARHKCLEF